MGRARVGAVVTGVRRVRARDVMVLAVVLVAEAVPEALEGAMGEGEATAVDAAGTKGLSALGSASSPS